MPCLSCCVGSIRAVLAGRVPFPHMYSPSSARCRCVVDSPAAKGTSTKPSPDEMPDPWSRRSRQPRPPRYLARGSAEVGRARRGGRCCGSVS